MTDADHTKSLIKVCDLLGTSAPAVRLIEAIERGVGAMLEAWQTRRMHKTAISNFESWQNALDKTGLTGRRAELTLADRATVRLFAENERHQQNRELVALQAADEFVHLDPKVQLNPGGAVDPAWIDRFWRLAQDVSDADMQAVWGRILARQSSGHGKYSPRCLEAVSLLTHGEIRILERLARFRWFGTANGEPSSFILHALHIENQTVTSELAARIAKKLGNLHREILGPAGITLDSGSGWAQSAILDFSEARTRVSIGGTEYLLELPKAEGPTYFGSCLGISPLGSEIFGLISTSPDEEYIELMTEAVETQAGRLTPKKSSK